MLIFGVDWKSSEFATTGCLVHGKEYLWQHTLEFLGFLTT
jgi:hypothetical protein